MKRSSRSLKLDRAKRSKQNWERGRGAKRKGNPRYKPMMRKGKKVYVLRDSKHQTGKIKNVKQDKRLKALHSGKRKSKSGKIYYEYRKNRSDKDRRVRL